MRPTPNDYLMQIQPYVGGKSKIKGVEKIIKLSSNESTLGPSPKALEAYRNAAATLFRYPDGGAGVLREAIAEVQSLPFERIVTGAGSDELIALLIHSYTKPGDEVLYSAHGFLMYKIYAQSFGAIPVAAPETGLKTDVDALLAAVTPKTRLVFVANPNNPTGSYISAAELKRLRGGLPAHVLLVVDAAYAEYVEEADYSNGAELVAATENTVMLRTFSKIYGLSSLRVGWAYCPEGVADALNRARGPFNTSGVGIETAAVAMRDVAYTDYIRTTTNAQLARVSAEVRALGLTVHPSVANFVLVEFPATPGRTAAEANRFLMQRGVIVREVAAYGLGHCLRISIGTEEENTALLTALGAFIAA